MEILDILQTIEFFILSAIALFALVSEGVLTFLEVMLVIGAFRYLRFLGIQIYLNNWNLLKSE